MTTLNLSTPNAPWLKTLCRGRKARISTEFRARLRCGPDGRSARDMTPISPVPGATDQAAGLLLGALTAGQPAAIHCTSSLRLQRDAPRMRRGAGISPSLTPRYRVALCID